MWTVAVLTTVLVAFAVAAVVVASSGRRTALILPAFMAGADVLLAAARRCDLRSGRRRG